MNYPRSPMSSRRPTDPWRVRGNEVAGRSRAGYGRGGQREGGLAMKTVIPAGVLLLAGCAHTSHVQDLGNGMHAVTASANWGGYTGSREETISQANDFCDKSRQTVAIESFEDKPGVSAKGEQTSTLNFRCTTRPVLQLR